MTKKSAGDAFEQLTAESANPTVDVCSGGRATRPLQAAERDLTLAYQSPNIHQLRDWAVSQAENANFRTVGIMPDHWALPTTRSGWRRRNCVPRRAGPTSPSPSTGAKW